MPAKKRKGIVQKAKDQLFPWSAWSNQLNARKGISHYPGKFPPMPKRRKKRSPLKPIKGTT